MRKLLVSMMVTLDGMFAGPEGDISWHNVDEEFNAFAIEQLNAVDTLIFGRVTYEGMASWWPTDMAITGDDPIVAATTQAEYPRDPCARTSSCSRSSPLAIRRRRQ